MKDEKSAKITNSTEKTTDTSEYMEVDVGFDDDAEAEPKVLEEISAPEKEPPIPPEWAGKSEEEIALLRRIQELEKKLEVTEKESFDKYARLQAEFDNFRKRSVKEKEGIINYASADIISKLLTSLDNFEIMLTNLEKTLEPKEFQGIKMIFQDLYGVLEKAGLTPIKAKGELFDPFVHEILTMEFTDEYPEETIIEVFQKGYKLKDRVIRPSKVKIAKPKRGEEKTKSSDTTEETHKIEMNNGYT